MLRDVSVIFGIIFLAAGILGFIPTCSPNQMLLGIFPVNAFHSFIHLVLGGFAVGFAFAHKHHTKRFLEVLGILLVFWGIGGLFYGENHIFGLITNNMADTILHLIAGVIALLFGFASKARRV